MLKLYTIPNPMSKHFCLRRKFISDISSQISYIKPYRIRVDVYSIIAFIKSIFIKSKPNFDNNTSIAVDILSAKLDELNEKLDKLLFLNGVHSDIVGLYSNAEQDSSIKVVESGRRKAVRRVSPCTQDNTENPAASIN
jgi:hypothetical protein